jgi:hypothetical protein
MSRETGAQAAPPLSPVRPAAGFGPLVGSRTPKTVVDSAASRSNCPEPYRPTRPVRLPSLLRSCQCFFGKPSDINQYASAEVPTQYVILSPAALRVSHAKHLPGNQRPFGEFTMRQEGLGLTTK